jgi:hypothetical protein
MYKIGKKKNKSSKTKYKTKYFFLKNIYKKKTCKTFGLKAIVNKDNVFTSCVVD